MAISKIRQLHIQAIAESFAADRKRFPQLPVEELEDAVKKSLHLSLVLGLELKVPAKEVAVLPPEENLEFSPRIRRALVESATARMCMRIDRYLAALAKLYTISRVSEGVADDIAREIYEHRGEAQALLKEAR